MVCAPAPPAQRAHVRAAVPAHYRPRRSTEPSPASFKKTVSVLADMVRDAEDGAALRACGVAEDIGESLGHGSLTRADVGAHGIRFWRRSCCFDLTHWSCVDCGI